MSSACTCHIDLKQCWWCLYEAEKAKVERYERALKFYANENSYVTDIGSFKIEATVMIDKGNRAKEALEG
ncbi:hypothetical protein K7T73_12730 [Bacillus badius]|uniref:hypothetical protein n=1 Tax=Bacillus badius TaxID=1455 RepID=UPI001CC0FACD|nr:hypothetical protein [Bacillus badius]UAT29465.1 hypothetical protein K7T73_12730 [Bacillus badius]